MSNSLTDESAVAVSRIGHRCHRLSVRCGVTWKHGVRTRGGHKM